MNFEDIYKAYWDKVFRLCMGYFNDYPLAQDLAQDVFARVWQYLPSFKGESSVGSWIFRIATNICLRQGERQRRISQTEVPPNVSVEAADDRSLHVQALYKAISGLSETDRLIISLYLINMSNIKDNLLQLIGKTPLVRLSNIYKDEYGTEIIAKVEYFNPGGSVKDRAAYAMIEAAETSGKLKKDGTIIEPTSGNTGIGMAWIAALKGYKVILTMPETMSIERRKLLKAFGSELVLTPGSEGMKGAIAKAEELNSQIKGSVILQQFKNPANPDIHYMTTANEIIEDAGKFDVFISCVGTGGSITGIGKRLKEKSPEIEIIAVEPKGSPVLSGGVAGPHKIQGIGAGFIPEIIETSYIDKIIQINDNDAFKMMRDLARKEGLLVGISSGAAVSAAVKLASNDSYKGKRIIVLLPDTGERYLSMDIASIHDLEDY